VLLALSAAALWLFLHRVQEGLLPLRPVDIAVSFIYGVSGPSWYAAKFRDSSAFTRTEIAIAITLFPPVGAMLHRILSGAWNASVGAGLTVGFFVGLAVASFCGIRFTRKRSTDIE